MRLFGFWNWIKYIYCNIRFLFHRVVVLCSSWRRFHCFPFQTHLSVGDKLKKTLLEQQHSTHGKPKHTAVPYENAAVIHLLWQKMLGKKSAINTFGWWANVSLMFNQTLTQQQTHWHQAHTPKHAWLCCPYHQPYHQLFSPVI